MLPCLLLSGLFSLPAIVKGQQPQAVQHHQSSSGSAAEAGIAPTGASGEETLSLADGARTVAKGTNKFISVEDLFRLDKKERETILNDIDDYNVTPGRITRQMLEGLPMSSRLNIESHPHIFTIE